MALQTKQLADAHKVNTDEAQKRITTLTEQLTAATTAGAAGAQTTATSVLLTTGTPVDRPRFVATLCATLEAVYDRVVAGDDADAAIQAVSALVG